MQAQETTVEASVHPGHPMTIQEEEQENSTTNTKSNDVCSLHSIYPRAGWISLLFLLGNVGLQIFSHLSTSATFLSSTPMDMNIMTKIPPLTGGESTSLDDISSSSNCTQDREGFDVWWETNGGNNSKHYYRPIFCTDDTVLLYKSGVDLGKNSTDRFGTPYKPLKLNMKLSLVSPFRDITRTQIAEGMKVAGSIGLHESELDEIKYLISDDHMFDLF